MADDEKEGGGSGEDSTFEALEKDFQEVKLRTIQNTFRLYANSLLLRPVKCSGSV